MQNEQNANKKNRNSNIEILRIIAMIMIVAHHFELYAVYNVFNNSELMSYVNIVIRAKGKIGVDIFILISGYFLIKSKINVKRVLKLWLQILFYSIGIMLVFKIFINNNITIKQMLKYALPISYRKYWFASTYMYLCLLIPYINKFVSNVNQKTYRNLIIVLTFLFSIMYSVLYKSNYYQTEVGTFETLTWFIYLYLLAGYIRIHGINFLEKNKTEKVLTVLVCIIFILFLCIIHFINIRYKRLIDLIDYYTKMNSIFILTISVCLFYTFKNMKLKQNKVVNNISSVAFSVYLISEHNLIRMPLWNIVRTYMGKYNINEIIIILLVVILLFFIAYIIEKVRVTLFERNIFKLTKINELCDKLDKYLE